MPFVLADTNSDWIVRRVLPAMAAFSRARVIGPIVSSRAFLGGDSNASYICRCCHHYYYYHRGSLDVHLYEFPAEPAMSITRFLSEVSASSGQVALATRLASRSMETRL